MSRKKTTHEFIAEAKAKWGDAFDYTESVYIANNVKLQIKCNTHQCEFNQSPSNHLLFNGCQICISKSQQMRFRKTTEQFIKEAQAIHKDKYDYSKVDYTTNHGKVTIICPTHGEFLAIPSQHLHGVDCAKCAIKKLPGGYFNKFFERNPMKVKQNAILYFLKFTPAKTFGGSFYKLGITSQNIERRYAAPAYATFDRELIWKSSGPLQLVHKMEVAIKRICAANRIAVEYPKFHGYTECFSQPIPVCAIPTILETDFSHLDIIASRLLIKSGIVENRIFARNTEVRQITTQEANEFFQNTHAQGRITRSTHCFGLYHDGILVAAMSFGTPRFNTKYEYELLRFSTNLHTIVIGGASKLFRAFVTSVNPSTIISYSDLRWGTGEVYLKLGFLESHRSSPNYWYVKDEKILSRVNCQKHKLPKLLESSFDANKTEYQNMIENGYRKIEDVGQIVFVWHK